MRKLTLGAVIILLISGSFATGQSVVVKSKKVVYKRTGKSVPDHQRTFEVDYPTFSGKLTPAALSSLRRQTDYWRVFDMKLADNLRREHWLSNFGYVVRYNKHNILDILLIAEGVAAYPDSAIRYFVFDTRTGRKLTVADLFTVAKMPQLLTKIREVMKRNEAAAIGENAETRETLEYYREAFPELHPTPERFTFKHLDGFSISDTGVTFIYDYDFAHVAEALEPSNEFFLSYAELKPFIRMDGLLARFVR